MSGKGSGVRCKIRFPFTSEKRNKETCFPSNMMGQSLGKKRNLTTKILSLKHEGPFHTTHFKINTAYYYKYYFPKHVKALLKAPYSCLHYTCPQRRTPALAASLLSPHCVCTAVQPVVGASVPLSVSYVPGPLFAAV